MRTLLLLYLWRYTIDYTRSRERMRKRGTFNYSFFFLIVYHSQLKQSCFWIIWAPTNFHHNNHHFLVVVQLLFSFVFTRAMPGASSSIAGYLYHNYEGESFYKGREKETRDIHKWRRTISEKKPEFDPKVPKLTLSLCEHLTNWVLPTPPIICHFWMPRPNFN